MSASSVSSKSVKKTVGHYSMECRKHFCDRAENAHHDFAKEPMILRVRLSLHLISSGEIVLFHWLLGCPEETEI